MASRKAANIAKWTILLLLCGLEMGRRFYCFCRVPLISAAFGGRKSRNLEMASGKGANIAKWTILLLLCGSLISAAFCGGKSRKSKGPWKWLPEKERILRNGRFCCFYWVPPEKERILRNGRFCCFCCVPLISAAFGGRKSTKSKGPWKWLPEKERILRNERFCCFCGVPLISAAFGGRKSRKCKGPWKWLPERGRILRNGRCCCFCRGSPHFGRANIAKWTILLLLWCSPHFGSFRRPEIQKIQRALEMASGKGANIAK